MKLILKCPYMLKNFLLVPFIAIFVLAYYYSGIVFAADTGQVTATVTVQNIALTVSDGTVAYGTLAASSTQNTATLTQSQTVQNTGNITIDVNIIGTDSAAWTLEAAVGANQYMHQFCLATCTSYPTNYTAMNADTYTLAINDLTATNTSNLDLGISTPTSSSSFTEQNVNVTVQAVSAT